MQHNVFQALLYISLIVIAILSFALYRVWTSDPQVAIRQMKRKLEQAEALLDSYRTKELEWINQMEQRKRDLERAERDLREAESRMEKIAARLEEQGKTIAFQNGVIERGEKYQKEQQEKIEWLVGRVIQMDLEKGVNTKLPWNA